MAVGEPEGLCLQAATDRGECRGRGDSAIEARSVDGAGDALVPEPGGPYAPVHYYYLVTIRPGGAAASPLFGSVGARNGTGLPERVFPICDGSHRILPWCAASA
jgi:hypothetical protein